MTVLGHTFCLFRSLNLFQTPIWLIPLVVHSALTNEHNYPFASLYYWAIPGTMGVKFWLKYVSVYSCLLLGKGQANWIHIL